MSDLDLAIVEQVLVYLADTPFACAVATPLTGGFANHTYRVHLRTPYKGHATVVLKHAKRYVRGLKTMAFSLDRQVYEVTALKEVKKMLPADSLVSVPEVFFFDEAASVIVMSDCGEGSLTLKQLLQEHTPSAELARGIGDALGVFVGRLHARGRSDRAFFALFEGNVEGRTASAFVTYGRLVSTFTTDQLPNLSDPPLELADGQLDAIDVIASEKIDAMVRTDETIVMGDLWPGNILVRLRHDAHGADAVEQIYVVDWEVAKPGLAGIDIGQFCAELLLLRRFDARGEEAASTVMESFLRSYRGGHAMDLDLARTALVHIGAHLIAWTPRIHWGAKEKVREVVQEGVRYLIEGSSSEESYVRNSAVGALLEQST